MKKALLCLALVAGLALAGCQTTPLNPKASKTVYSGVLPCADCSGIHTTLTLYRNQDGHPSRYELRQEYVGAPKATTHVDRGAWSAGVTRLDGQQYPLVILNPNESDGRQLFVQNARNAVERLDDKGQLIHSGMNETLIQQ